MLGVTISAIMPELRPPPCPNQSPSCKKASTWQQTIFYASLFLTAVGSGGIRPCVVAFGAEQLVPEPPTSPESGKKQKWNFFNLYFLCIGVSVMLALTVVVYIQDNLGWGLGFGIPTAAMFVSVVVFVAGYPLYIKQRPGGSPLTRVAQVVVAAVRKRRLRVPTDASLLYQDKEIDAGIATAGRLSHTKQFKFLDRAAITGDGDMSETGRPLPWRLSTVHRVEELKFIFRIIPIWSVGIIIVAAGNNFTFPIVQAKAMNRRIAGHFNIPPATLLIFSAITMLLTLSIYDRILIPLARRVTGHPGGISPFRRMGVGLAIYILSNVTAAVVESQRRRAAVKLNVFWLVPQYALHGVAEGFAAVGLMEFLYDQAPESMKSLSAALYWLSISLGHYGGTLLVTTVNEFTKKWRKSGSWLQNDIDKGRLDYFYWLLAGLEVFNLGYFLFCARFYVFKRLEIAGDLEEKGGGEVGVVAGAMPDEGEVGTSLNPDATSVNMMEILAEK
ncbi:putative nitrite transporter [Platanthera guangdongensis]|uniref:Nitrite transporter n=1 Tax=Platanthera guangdongensis TaxID=2320717 RepID=A0ABR2M7R8_9ASPA